jgi:hypothetical protein
VSDSNGHIVKLAAELTTADERERYAQIVLHFQRLSQDDDLFQFMELLGIFALAGKRLPEALNASTAAAEEYHRKVDERLAALPSEIADSVDAKAIAESMSEAFRQQLVTAGLHDTALLVKAAATTIKTLSAEITTSLKPATQEYASMAASFTAETAKLIAVSSQIGEANKALRVQKGFWQVGFFVMLAIVCALFFKVI